MMPFWLANQASLLATLLMFWFFAGLLMLFARTDKPLALSGGIKPLPEIVHRTEQFEILIPTTS